MGRRGENATKPGANGHMGQADCWLFSQEEAEVATISGSVAFCNPLAEEDQQERRNIFIQIDLSQVENIKRVIDEAHERLRGTKLLL